MESHVGGGGLQRWAEPKLFSSAQTIYASELLEYRQVGDSIALKARGPRLRSCSASP